MFFVNTKGVKCINQKIKSQQFDKYPIIESKQINPKNLFIGFDGLKDQYSLAGVPIDKSPHLDLIKVMLSDGNYEKTDYYDRLRLGYLDMRFNQKFKSEIYERVLFERKDKIEKEEYQAVKVVMIEGQYYIIDGKHTAALCCAMEKKVNCIEIMNPLHDPFYVKVYEIMKKRASQFEKNISLLKKVYQYQ